MTNKDLTHANRVEGAGKEVFLLAEAYGLQPPQAGRRRPARQETARLGLLPPAGLCCGCGRRMAIHMHQQ